MVLSHSASVGVDFRTASVRPCQNRASASPGSVLWIFGRGKCPLCASLLRRIRKWTSAPFAHSILRFPRNIDACRWDNELKSDEFYSAVLMTSRQFKNQTRISCDLCDGIAGLGTGRPPAQSSLETPHLLWHQASVNEATNSFTTATAFHRLRSLQQWTLQRSMESHSAFSLIETDLTQREGSWSARQI